MADRPPPNTLSIVIATAIISAIAGYFLGQAKSIGVFNSGESPNIPAKTQSARTSDDEDDDWEDEVATEFEDDGGECKLVLVVRTDLGMTKGKIAAQCSHATLACYKALQSSSSPAARAILQRWERLGQAKVAVQVKSEDELETLQAQALSLGICARVIHDAGRTQIAAGSATVLGVGPAPKAKVDLVTGSLKLL